MIRLTRELACVALAALLAAPALAECDELFPDLTCDRSGRFDGFEMPIVQPYLFEDPFITTGVYPYYVWHQFPKSSPLEGGEAHVLAAQLRIAVTDRFAIIATKDGYMWSRPDNPLLEETGGFMNLGFGVKYALYQDRDAGRIVSLALKYEAPSGNDDVFQGEGDGMLMPSITGAMKLGDLAVQGDLGGIWAIDHRQSSSIYYHLYFGYPIADRITPFLQFSGMHWVDSGDGTQEIELSAFGEGALGTDAIPIGLVEVLYGQRFEGADVANLGAFGVDGLDYVTVAIGAHLRVTDRLTVSAAWERPITDHKSITSDRVTTNVAFEF
ncbi:MAG: hypothetical protein FJ091_11525 [Deltaproteobacteria bacterium]|nr:hypothetical protein [Deltaproteobacteria bacterium]